MISQVVALKVDGVSDKKIFANIFLVYIKPLAGTYHSLSHIYVKLNLRKMFAVRKSGGRNPLPPRCLMLTIVA